MTDDSRSICSGTGLWWCGNESTGTAWGQSNDQRLCGYDWREVKRECTGVRTRSVIRQHNRRSVQRRWSSLCPRSLPSVELADVCRFVKSRSSIGMTPSETLDIWHINRQDWHLSVGFGHRERESPERFSSVCGFRQQICVLLLKRTRTNNDTCTWLSLVIVWRQLVSARTLSWKFLSSDSSCRISRLVFLLKHSPESFSFCSSSITNVGETCSKENRDLHGRHELASSTRGATTWTDFSTTHTRSVHDLRCSIHFFAQDECYESEKHEQRFQTGNCTDSNVHWMVASHVLTERAPEVATIRKAGVSVTKHTWVGLFLPWREEETSFFHGEKKKCNDFVPWTWFPARRWSGSQDVTWSRQHGSMTTSHFQIKMTSFPRRAWQVILNTSRVLDFISKKLASSRA